LEKWAHHARQAAQACNGNFTTDLEATLTAAAHHLSGHTTSSGNGSPRRAVSVAQSNDITNRLWRIAADTQCDCHICDTATIAATVIEQLREIGDELVAAIEDHAWLNVDRLIGQWDNARHG
jgi:hypothetical protein